jgi:hypothetical protein
LFGLREIEEREIEKREREKKLEFSSVWQAEKVRRENNDWWAPQILVFSLDMRRKCKDGTKHCKMTFMPLNITCSILFFYIIVFNCYSYFLRRDPTRVTCYSFVVAYALGK